ncbi:ThuA domain-containing protein [Thermogutta sp.]|uniref:ThuA domain-containing protein n=1 Tax=Thermogutta sp. TaxID=1962930 RepID=UPI003220528F
MRRREMLKLVSGGFLAMMTHSVAHAGRTQQKKKVLFFTRNVGYYHDIVKRKTPNELSFAEQRLVEIAGDMDVEVVCTKDGRVFDQDLSQYDAFAFYCNGDLTQPNDANEPPMSAAGKERLLTAIREGKGFFGFHSTCACWRTPGDLYANAPPEKVDPFLRMVGAEFLTHGPQQEASLTLVSHRLPPIASLGIAEGVAFFDEWYSLKNFNPDMHVILVQETRYLEGDCYRRPPFPCTWARREGKGHVFFTSMGHTEDVWTSPIFATFVTAGLNWVLKNVDVELPANFSRVTPQADVLPQKPTKK